MFESIDFSKSEQYTLSIRLGTDGFSFSLFDALSEGDSLIADRAVDTSTSLLVNLKQTLREEQWLTNAFRKVYVLIDGNRYTTLPLELFEDEQAEAFFRQNFAPARNEVVRYQLLHRSNVVVLFGMDKSLSAYLEEQFHEVNIRSQAAMLMEHFSQKSTLGNNRKLYAHVQPAKIDVYAYDRRRLLLANSFDCRLTPDRIYYLLYVWNRLGLDQERDELNLCGELTDKDALLNGLKKYVRQVFVLNPADHVDLRTIPSCE
jgi:hypothetical protein